MTTNSRSTTVGVFRDRTMAEQAMKALQDARFGRDQIRYAGMGYTGGGAGGFLEDIKNLFTGQGTTSGDFANNLKNMGLTDDEARYYANEYSNGHPIITVSAPGREQEAMSILQGYGAYNYAMSSGAAETPAYAQQTSGQQTSGYAQPGSYPPADTTPPVQTSEAQSRVTQPQDQATRAPENQQAASTTSPNDQFQATQAQLQAVQRQLQETQAQLQAAKQREAELQAAQQRKAELQAAQQRDSQIHDLQRQLQEAQAQLQSTQAELQATQARITQANQ